MGESYEKQKDAYAVFDSISACDVMWNIWVCGMEEYLVRKKIYDIFR